jgi:dihydrofolate reductase
MGGAKTIKAFNDAGIIDRMEIFIIPVLLGGGVRLFEEGAAQPQLLKLEDVQPYANGVVKVTYTTRG